MDITQVLLQYFSLPYYFISDLTKFACALQACLRCTQWHNEIKDFYATSVIKCACKEVRKTHLRPMDLIRQLTSFPFPKNE